MRATPQFDPRIQPTAIYPPGPSQVYLKPPTHANVLPPHNYPQNTPPTQNFGVPIYQVHHPPPPVLAAPVGPPVVQAMPSQPIPGHPQPVKPKPALTSIYGQSEGYPTRGATQQQAPPVQQMSQQGEGEGDEQVKNQQIILFWQHKFYTIVQRFQQIFEKVESFRMDFQRLNEQLRSVDSEEEWNQAKEHHEDYMEQLEQFTQELAGVINENINLVQQNENEPNDQLIWKQRYFELFQGYKNMEEELLQLKQTKPSEPQNNKLNDLMNNYRELQREYNQAVNELSELKEHKEKEKDTNPIPTNNKNYKDNLDYTLKEAEKYKEILEQLSKENEELDALVSELKDDKKKLENTLENNRQTNVQQNYDEFKRAIGQRDQQITLLNKQLKNLSEKYNQLVESHNQIQNQMENQLQQDPILKSKIIQLQQQIDSKNRETKETKNKLIEAENREKTTGSMSEEYQRLLKVRTGELQERNDQLQKLRKEALSAASTYKSESQRDLAQIRKDYDSRMKKVQQQFQNKLESIKRKLRAKEQQSENHALLTIKIQSLEKKNKMLLQEIQTLTQELSEKDKENVELKRVGPNQERLKELQYQFNMAVEEKEQLKATLSQKSYDIEALEGQIKQFEGRIQQLNSKSYGVNSIPLLGEIEELNNLVQIKQNQINKSKANLTLKDNHIKDLQTEIEKCKNAVITNQKIYEQNKDDLQENIRLLQRKNQQNQKKMKDLQFQFGSTMKKNLQQEIRNLRNQNQSRQQNIIRLQAEELELRSRISHYERVRATHSSDIEELANRIKDLEASKFQMIRKVETSFRDVKKKEKETKELAEAAKELKDRILKLEGEIVLNEKLIKEKDSVIQNLEDQLLVANSRLGYLTEQHDSLRTRQRNETDQYFKQSDELKKKLLEYEHMSHEKKQFHQKFSAEISKIENQMIQRLKEEKEFLQNELATALQQLGTIPAFEKRGAGETPKKFRASEGIDYIQKRLFEFNTKIDDIIIKNREINNRQFGNNRENVNQISRQRQLNNRQNQQQIKGLKGQIQELRKYIAKLEVETAGEMVRYNPRSELIMKEQQRTYNERMQFYQSQTNELESRIESLLKVNSTLKERLESLLRGEGKNSAMMFYKEQLAMSEETADNLNTKLKKLLDENRSLKHNSSETTTKMCREYQDKIFECQNKIFSLERKISSLELQKTKSENDKAIVHRNLNSVQSELHSIKSNSEKQAQTTERRNKELSDQVINYEGQISELLGKIRLLESENNRLTEAMHVSYSQQHILLNTPVKTSPKNAFAK